MDRVLKQSVRYSDFVNLHIQTVATGKSGCKFQLFNIQSNLLVISGGFLNSLTINFFFDLPLSIRLCYWRGLENSILVTVTSGFFLMEVGELQCYHRSLL